MHLRDARDEEAINALQTAVMLARYLLRTRAEEIVDLENLRAALDRAIRALARQDGR